MAAKLSDLTTWEWFKDEVTTKSPCRWEINLNEYLHFLYCYCKKFQTPPDGKVT